MEELLSTVQGYAQTVYDWLVASLKAFTSDQVLIGIGALVLLVIILLIALGRTSRKLGDALGKLESQAEDVRQVTLYTQAMYEKKQAEAMQRERPRVEQPAVEPQPAPVKEQEPVAAPQPEVVHQPVAAPQPEVVQQPVSDTERQLQEMRDQMKRMEEALALMSNTSKDDSEPTPPVEDE